MNSIHVLQIEIIKYSDERTEISMFTLLRERVPQVTTFNYFIIFKLKFWGFFSKPYFSTEDMRNSTPKFS